MMLPQSKSKERTTRKVALLADVAGTVVAAAGFYEISGLAHSGKGRIAKVLVSADGGQSWGEAALQQPVLSMAFTRFRMPWQWNGGPAVLQSRAWDKDGNAQPTRAQFVAARRRRRDIASKGTDLSLRD